MRCDFLRQEVANLRVQMRGSRPQHVLDDSIGVGFSCERIQGCRKRFRLTSSQGFRGVESLGPALPFDREGNQTRDLIDDLEVMSGGA